MRRVSPGQSRRTVTITARRVPMRSVGPAGVPAHERVLALQRAAGNKVTTTALSGLSSSPSHEVVRRMKLSGAKRSQYRNKFKRWAGDADTDEGFNEFVEWCATTRQADDVLDSLNYDQWGELSLAMTGAEADKHATAQVAYKESLAPKAKKEADKYAEVKGKLSQKKLKLADFTDQDLDAIILLKGTMGWDAAIGQVHQQIVQAQQTAALNAALLVKYSQAKTAGDLLFPNGLLQSVWNVAYNVATSSAANVNTTVAGQHLDTDILPAVVGWRHEANTTLGQSPGTVKDFHVPGGAAPIQDKSTRPVNPDPTRGRQADFISTWGNTSINVHVDADPQH